MLKTCIRCGKNIDLYRNSDQTRCSYCGYDFLKEEFVTIFSFENISHIHKNFVFSQVAPFQPVAVRPTTAIENERAKELSKLCRAIGAVVKTKPSSNKNNEIIRLCQCINAIAEDVYNEALSKIPISELLSTGGSNNFTALSLIDIIKTIPISDLKKLIMKCNNDEKAIEEKK